MKRNKKQKSAPIGEKIADALELPREVAAGTLRVTVWADREAEIINHKGIIEYDTEIIKLNSVEGVVTIYGQNLDIKSITDEDISVTGKIFKIEM
ncbi:MAG: sporulation protein YqfC [Clostridia bacterium]|nr:sporulation protein YqfC [Clostridia bacterium]